MTRECDICAMDGLKGSIANVCEWHYSRAVQGLAECTEQRRLVANLLEAEARGNGTDFDAVKPGQMSVNEALRVLRGN
jgi:hypothetical protein